MYNVRNISVYNPGYVAVLNYLNSFSVFTAIYKIFLKFPFYEILFFLNIKTK